MTIRNQVFALIELREHTARDAVACGQIEARYSYAGSTSSILTDRVIAQTREIEALYAEARTLLTPFAVECLRTDASAHATAYASILDAQQQQQYLKRAAALAQRIEQRKRSQREARETDASAREARRSGKRLLASMRAALRINVDAMHASQ